MKLKSLAALFFRIVGACGVIDGLFGLAFRKDVGSVIVGIFTVLVGCGLIYYSKAIARLFCRGLDDDAA
jgi:hypothetical protein